MNQNLKAFLEVIAFAEGADYNTYYQGSKFKNLSEHPYITKEKPKIPLKGTNLFSTAAGKYQITATTWNEYKKRVNLTDFSPESQDKFAIFLIDKIRKALKDVEDGYLDIAMNKCRNEWASFDLILKKKYPKTFDQCVEVFIKNGGIPMLIDKETGYYSIPETLITAIKDKEEKKKFGSIY